MNKVSVFLPMRKGSQRVKNKNTRQFANFDGGLSQLKIEQLLRVNSIDKIYISTNDEEIINIADSFKEQKIIIDRRRAELCSSETSTDDLIKYVPSVVFEEHILWTHVTSPFVDDSIYERAILEYFENIKNYDSLMSVTKIQKFLWDDNGPLNYSREQEKWPRTQTMKEVYEINSGIFICPREIYLNNQDRVGIKPFMLQFNPKQSMDIDWEEDFILAEQIWGLKN